jgi:TonB family protein
VQAAPAAVEPAAAPVSPAESAEPVPAPVAAPAPAPAAPPGPSSEYIAKVRAAVQAAFVYPPAAAALGIPRRTRVAFTLHGAVPVDARVLIGSGMAMMDRAALQSVQAASYPPPPPEMKGADASFEVWVEFKP